MILNQGIFTIQSAGGFPTSPCPTSPLIPANAPPVFCSVTDKQHVRIIWFTRRSIATVSLWPEKKTCGRDHLCGYEDQIPLVASHHDTLSSPCSGADLRGGGAEPAYAPPKPARNAGCHCVRTDSLDIENYEHCWCYNINSQRSS